MMITLKAARVNKNLTQSQAAYFLGVSEATLRNYELGRSFPDALVLKKIEELYGVGYDDLIFLPENHA